MEQGKRDCMGREGIDLTYRRGRGGKSGRKGRVGKKKELGEGKDLI